MSVVCLSAVLCGVLVCLDAQDSRPQAVTHAISDLQNEIAAVEQQTKLAEEDAAKADQEYARRFNEFSKKLQEYKLDEQKLSKESLKDLQELKEIKSELSKLYPEITSLEVKEAAAKILTERLDLVIKFWEQDLSVLKTRANDHDDQECQTMLAIVEPRVRSMDLASLKVADVGVEEAEDTVVVLIGTLRLAKTKLMESKVKLDAAKNRLDAGVAFWKSELSNLENVILSYISDETADYLVISKQRTKLATAKKTKEDLQTSVDKLTAYLASRQPVATKLEKELDSFASAKKCYDSLDLVMRSSSVLDHSNN